MNALTTTANAASSSLIGVSMVLIYDVLDATKEVYSGNLVQSNDPLLLTGLVFLVVALFFQIFALSVARPKYSLPLMNGRALILLNLFTLGAWVGFFYSVKYLEPAIASTLMVGLGPALIVVLAPILPTQGHTKWEACCSAGILAGSVWLVILSFYGQSAVGEISRAGLLIGVFTALLSSICMVGASIYSKQLSLMGAPPAIIMAHRFYLLVPVALLGGVFSHDSTAAQLPSMSSVGILALFGVVIPLWCLQVAIKHLRPTEVMMLISITPILTWLLQLFDQRLQLEVPVLICVALVGLFAWASRWQVASKG